ncbi:alpha/beta fold hydrolase [candidate division KSB1 bacterium]|nr:alpha/beta fold hydrolase [candidate division KSB1 bacterium]NIR73391.1 alpha/beta fold hydrolase [candidate division KSB1 bacterium]NIS28390.1 alpha/beta fold hydrolase [candidate division KSB1 bacterium]NIT75271.1 alpha/beta fold hydrolase [candidate division KSB1 bacterium]NIU29118.1 alpha/beta fold hydrolase [candidate division KSB1 bacterium]
MTLILGIVTALVVLVLGLLFFSRPRTSFSHPTADIETTAGRTTLYHYRAKHPQGIGVIVMVHGFCENHMYFENLAEPLTEAGFDCMAINLFGYGGSMPNATDAYTVEAYVQQVREALLELERLQMIKNLVAVWGHSMGGAVVYLSASEIIRSHPEVKGIFLENPGFGNNLTLLAKLSKPFSVLANLNGPRYLLQIFVNLLFAWPIKDNAAKSFLKRLLINHAPRKHVALANVKSNAKLDFSTQNVSESALKKLYAIFSENDKIVSFRKARRQVIDKLREHSAFAEDKLLTLPKTDHFASLQSPNELAAFALKQLEEENAGVHSESLQGN